MIVRVLLDQNLDRELDYAVSDTSLAEKISLGSRVRVPIRGRLVLGTVVELPEQAHYPELKEIHEIVGERPVLNESLLKLARWISDYYCCPMPGVMRSLLPNVIRRAEVGFREQVVVTLTAKQFPSEELEALKKKSPKQYQIIQRLLEQVKDHPDDPAVPLKELIEDCQTTAAPVNALVQKGLVAKEKRRVERDPVARENFLRSDEIELNPEQRGALDLFETARGETSSPKPILLYGVTGSGKTEVYLQAIRRVISSGQSAIVLVPEISLTPQTVERFKSRFSDMQDEVAVLHSHLSEGERHDEWHKINDGRARIVIGARSAIFAPLTKLGLIVVDEEHESSYKQDEAPRYHARDVAVLRASFENCPIILGSATPSMESYHNVELGKYKLARLTERADAKGMPLMRVIDMRLEPREKNRSHDSRDIPAPISRILRQAIEKRLEVGEQVILFLNRRGFSSSLQCTACGEPVLCPNCTIALTYHRKDDFMSCHLCGHTQIPPRRCPQPDCEDEEARLRHLGFGTEKIEQAVTKIFPQARVARLDADALVRRHTLGETLQKFRTGKIDILVGTQMIAKGLHFPNVTLVGIVYADMGLYQPDFRGGERTFQLLTQVAGRAGRGETLGEVFVQTSTPHHAAIQYSRHHDFDGFWEAEKEMREQFRFPPYWHMILVTVRSKRQALAEFTANTIFSRLEKICPENIELHPVQLAPIARAAEYHRYHLSLRAEKTRPMSRLVRHVLDQTPLAKDVLVAVDVDPYSLL